MASHFDRIQAVMQSLQRLDEIRLIKKFAQQEVENFPRLTKFRNNVKDDFISFFTYDVYHSIRPYRDWPIGNLPATFKLYAMANEFKIYTRTISFPCYDRKGQAGILFCIFGSKMQALRPELEIIPEDNRAALKIVSLESKVNCNCDCDACR